MAVFGVRLGWVCVFLAFALLSACATEDPTGDPGAGGDEEETGDQEPAQNGTPEEDVGTEPAGEADTDFRIGFLSAGTGGFAFQGESLREGFQLALDELGSEFGETTVEVIFEDEGTTPDSALNAARRLVDSEGVDMLVGPVASPSAVALADEFAAREGVPLLVPLALTDELTEGDVPEELFRVQVTARQGNEPFGRWLAEEAGYETLNVTATDFPAGRDSAAAAIDGFTGAGGTIAGEVYPEFETTDFGPHLSQLNTDADAVYGWFSGPDAVQFVNAFSSFGLRDQMDLVGFAGLNEEFILNEIDPAAEGVVTLTPYTPTFESEENERFVEAYESEYGEPPALPAANAWVSMQVIRTALESIPQYDGNVQELLDALESVEVTTPRGDISFDDNHQVVSDVYVVETQRVDDELQNTVTDVITGVQQ